MAAVSDKNDGRPSLETENVSDEGPDQFDEIKFDPSQLDASILKMPSIPKELGADDIDKVIAALTNVPDVKIHDSPKKSTSSSRHKSAKKRAPSSDYDDDDYSKRRRQSGQFDEDFPLKRIPIGMLRGRSRGRLRIRARGAGRGRGYILEQARGLFGGRSNRSSRNAAPINSRGADLARGVFPVARGRNIFPEDEEGGEFGRGRGRVVRENALFKRFKQQHRPDELDEYGDRKTRSRTKSKTRSISSSSSKSRSSSSSSSSDSDSSPRKKKKKKEKKKKKKGGSEKKKKKKKKQDKDSTDEENDTDWRVTLLNRMKNIKNLPPEQLEVEFKKAMAEKRKKEEEEKYRELIKHRQKLARKVKKESEKAAKKAAKEEMKKKEKEDENRSFYAGVPEPPEGRRKFTEAVSEDEEEEKDVKPNPTGLNPFQPVSYPVFKSSFAEVSADAIKDEEDEDPYIRALDEHNKRKPKEENIDDVSWPAGALEEGGLDEAGIQEGREELRIQMELEQEQARQALDDRTKHVVNASKMFSKIRNRIKGKPLKINLKMNKPVEEEPGLQPYTGENTPGDGLSEGEKEENWYDEDTTEYDFTGRDDIDLVRRMERMRRKNKEVHDPGELEDGERSPSPTLERPHLRRRRRMKVKESRDGTPLLDEKVVVEEKEEGELDNDGTPTSPPRSRAPWRSGLPPPTVGAALPFIDTSVPPPNLTVGFPPFRPGYNNPTSSNHFNVQDKPPLYDAYSTPPPGFPLVLPAVPPPVPVLNPELLPRTGSRPALLGVPPPSIQPGYDSFSRTSSERDRYGRRYDDRRDDFDRRDDRYDRSRDRDRYERDRSDRRDRRDDRRDGHHFRHSSDRRSSERTDDYSRSRRSYREESDDDQIKQEDGAFDITKITPIMKYIAKHLEEAKYPLELRGPFAFNHDSPGLSKHLFVAFKMVEILEAAGYDQGKMYMQAMFPMGMGDTKKEIIEKATKGTLHPEINGPKLVKMCVRSIKCFIAYFSGKKDDIKSSDDEEGEDDNDQSSSGRETRTVNTSLSAILGRIKESAGEEMNPDSDPLNRVLETPNYNVKKPGLAEIPDTIHNHWDTMDTQIRADHLKSFTGLQNHFSKQLMGKGLDPRDARDEAANCMMCLVVTGWSDSMLREMVTRFKKTILPEQNALEDRRTGSDRTLFDQMVDLMLKHQAEFPWAVMQQIEQEDNPKEALLKRVRNIVERMLKFYMRGCGKLQEGREQFTTQPNAPGDYQFNYLPEGLREDEVNSSHVTPKKTENNFFNMEAAAVANRSFSTYTKRHSVDEPGQDWEPVSPDNGEIIKGALPKKKYLFGTMYIDTLQYRGSNFVYEIGLYMSDTSSCEVYIVPTNLYNQRSVLEMLGFSFNPEEGKFIFVKPGGGFQKTYGEKQGVEKIMQFLKEKRYESKGDSKNAGLVLTTQSTEELATWEMFSRFHKVDMELDQIVAGYGVLDLFIEDSKDAYSYVGPKMNREPDKTFFTWEYNRSGRASENMAGTKAGSVFKILEDLLEAAPDYENFIRQYCFQTSDSRFDELRRRQNIIKDLHTLECFLSEFLNERTMRRKIYTGGVFYPGSTAELGDKPGLIASRFIRLMVACGLSRPALRDRAAECKERRAEFILPMEPVLRGLRKQEEKEKCREQIYQLTKETEQFLMNK